MNIIVFGNSGSGKSSLAKSLAAEHGIAHLDLDSIAWLPEPPPKRRPVDDSLSLFAQFANKNTHWVIEGCYADLLTRIGESADTAYFLNLPLALCQDNARNRPWEPHKYPSKKAQDDNLPMLLEWIANYETRTDEFSLAAHQRLFANFSGKKVEYKTRPNLTP
jgi:adenylate kinase family enzyme